MKLIPAALILALAASVVAADDYTLGDLTIAHPHAFETARTAMSGAGYLTVANNGTQSDRLVEVQSDFPRSMIHVTETDANGIARMTHLDTLEIPAGQTVTFAPGGLHVMFTGLGGYALEAGESFDATLVFEKAGAVDVTFTIEKRGAGSMDHTEMPPRN